MSSMAAFTGPPRSTQISFRSRPLSLLCSRCFVALLAASGGLAGLSTTAALPAQPVRIDLIKDLPSAGDLAAPANGQTLYILDESRGEIIAIDPFEPAKRWTAVAAPDAATKPLAIGCIDTSTLAILCRKANAWSLQTHRPQPGTTADPGRSGQTVAIGAAAAVDKTPPAAAAVQPPEDGRPCLVVSPSRDWLAVCGLPAPLPAVVRGPIAGARIGSMSARACPTLAAGLRPAAATISTADEFVLFTTNPASRGSASIFVSFQLPPDPRQLLSLDTTLSSVRDAAFCRADGTLWVVGGGVGGGGTAASAAPEGLWRIDAVLRDGRQSAQAVCVARLDAPRAVACLSERAIIVTHGRAVRMVSRFDPTQTAPDAIKP